MSDIYMSYLTEAEREEEIMFASINTEIENTLALLEMVNIRADVARRNAELSVFKESGTYEDLEKLLTEAEETAQADQSGLLTKLFNAVKALAKGIIDAIGKAFNELSGKVNPEAEVKVDKGEYDVINKFASGWGNIKSTIGNFISGVTGGKTEGGMPDITALGVTALATAGSVIAVKAGALQKAGEVCKDACTTVEGWIKSLENYSKPKEDDGKLVTFIKTITGGLTAFLNLVKKYANKVFEWLKSVGINVVDKAKAGVEKVKSKFKKREDGGIDLSTVDDNLKSFKFTIKLPTSDEQIKATVTLSNPENNKRQYDIHAEGPDGHITLGGDYWTTQNGKALINKAKEQYNKIVAAANAPAEEPANNGNAENAEQQPAQNNEQNNAQPAENTTAQESTDDIMKSIFGDDYIVVDESVNNETNEVVNEFLSLFE